VFLEHPERTLGGGNTTPIKAAKRQQICWFFPPFSARRIAKGV
jgi:hypothetical protein